MFGPPEKVWSDKVETTVPGLVFVNHGSGSAAYIPWDVGGLYYRHSSEAHRGLLADVIDRLLPGGRQLRTNAHPLVEMTLMEQPARRRIVDPSGQRDRAPGHGLLSAGRDPRHPHRAGERRRSARAGRRARPRPCPSKAPGGDDGSRCRVCRPTRCWWSSKETVHEAVTAPAATASVREEVQ